MEDEANNVHQTLIHKDNTHHNKPLFTILSKLALYSISSNSIFQRKKTKKKPEKKMAMKLWASSTANALKLSCTNRTGASPSLTFSIFRCFSSVLDGLKYSSSHEWIKHEGSVATVGITDHAQGHLGEVVFVELPESGSTVTKGGGFGAVESVKATSDVNSPISGQVVEVNTKLTETPGLINSSPYGDGWMIKVRPSSPSELEALMDPGEYAKFCEEEDAHH